MMNKFMIALYLMFLAQVFLWTVWTTIFVATWIPVVIELRSACVTCERLK